MVIRINLYPRQKSYYRLLMFVGSCVLISFFAVYCMFVVSNLRFRGMMDGVQEELDKLKSELVYADGKNLGLVLTAEIERVKKELSGIDQQIRLFTQPVQTDDLLMILPKLTDCLPNSLWLTKIKTSEEQRLLFEGKSIDYIYVIQWINALQKIPGLGGIHLLYVESEQTVQFGLEIEVNSDVQFNSA